MPNPNWKSFWQNYRKIEAASEADLFFQVGKTINSLPIAPETFQEMAADVVESLALKPEDVLLELCCGNGLMTKAASQFCQFIYAFDFAEHLIEAARQFCSAPNIRYAVGDAEDELRNIFRFDQGAPQKFLMADALAHFQPENLSRILRNIEQITDQYCLYLTGIPCEAQKWDFYDTPERRQAYEEGVLRGDPYNAGIGRWWREEELQDIAADLVVECIVKPQKATISRYRMDALFIR